MLVNTEGIFSRFAVGKYSGVGERSSQSWAGPYGTDSQNAICDLSVSLSVLMNAAGVTTVIKRIGIMRFLE